VTLAKRHARRSLKDLDGLAGGFAKGRREQDNTLLRYKVSLIICVDTEVVERVLRFTRAGLGCVHF
jgi:hypothetical protein